MALSFECGSVVRSRKIHTIYDLVRREIVPFNYPEAPSAQFSKEAIEACHLVAAKITKQAQDITGQRYISTPLRFIATLEVLMATHHRHTKFLALPSQDFRLIFGQDYMNMLMQFSQFSNHPPRGSHWNMWINVEDSEPVMYTGHADERRFGLLVRKTHSVMSQLSDYGLALISGQASIRSHEVQKRLTELSDDLEDLRKDYFAFGHHSPRPEVDYGDRWFLHFRQFLAPLEIGRRVVRGPNPAHVASWPEVDILYGLANENYLNSVRGRYCSYLPEDMFRLERAMGLTTVPEVLRSELSNAKISEVERERIIHVFRHLVKRLQAISGVHWSAIVKHLKKPEPKPTADSNVAGFLSVDAGVSGRDLRETEELLEIRRNRNQANDLLKDFEIGSRIIA